MIYPIFNDARFQVGLSYVGLVWIWRNGDTPEHNPSTQTHRSGSGSLHFKQYLDSEQLYIIKRPIHCPFKFSVFKIVYLDKHSLVVKEGVWFWIEGSHSHSHAPFPFKLNHKHDQRQRPRGQSPLWASSVQPSHSKTLSISIRFLALALLIFAQFSLNHSWVVLLNRT